jgi:hypothetical protein
MFTYGGSREDMESRLSSIMIGSGIFSKIFFYELQGDYQQERPSLRPKK